MSINIYDCDAVLAQEENDEISAEEAGFMVGYLELES